MNESKIGLTERLRREGRWAEASRFKDQTVKTLRGEGMKRAEAGEAAWRRMAEAYPPLAIAGPVPESAAADGLATGASEDEATKRLCDVATGEVERWQQRYGITLPDDARSALIGEGLMYFWAMGLLEVMPAVGQGLE
jgi:hypothetical protein